MPEPAICSKENILWPWVAASVAIHGLLLFWYVEGDTPAMAGAEHVVEVAISTKKSAKQMTKPLKEAQKQSQEADRSVEKEKALSVAEHAEQAVAQATGMAATTSTNTAAQAPSSVDDAKQESLVRNHLERFKFYPMSARRRGIVGEVEVAFELSARGQANMLKILTASGYRVLDDAALEAVRRAVPFPVERGAFHFKLLFRTSS